VSALDIAIGVAVLVFVLLLIRAANTLSQNPHQQIRAHEDLIGQRFPPDMTYAEKRTLIDRAGVSPTNPKRIWTLLIVVALIFAILVWQRYAAP
jgi:hypothetical protein